MNSNRKSKFAPLYVITAGILWGMMGLLVRRMNEEGYTSMEITAFRAVISAVVLSAISLIIKPQSFKIRVKDIWVFLGTGLLSVVFFNVCYFSCMTMTTLSVAAILLYTAPAFVLILSFFIFKEKLTGRKLICLVMTFIGCVLVSGGPGSIKLSIPGLLLGLGAGFGYALYSIFGKIAVKKGYSSLTITVYTFIFATAGTLILIKPAHFINCLTVSRNSIPLEAFLVLLNTVAAYILYTKGLEGTETGKASILATIEPVTACVVGMIFFGEFPGIVAYIGIVLVLAGCIIQNIKSEKTSNFGKRIDI